MPIVPQQIERYSISRSLRPRRGEISLIGAVQTDIIDHESLPGLRSMEEGMKGTTMHLEHLDRGNKH